MSRSWNKAMKSCQGHGRSWKTNVKRQKKPQREKDTMSTETMADHEEAESPQVSKMVPVLGHFPLSAHRCPHDKLGQAGS